MAGSFTVGSIVARLKLIGQSQFIGQIKKIDMSLKAWSQRATRLLTLPFRLAIRAVRKFGRVAIWTFRSLHGVLRRIRWWFLNLRTAIIAAALALGAFGLVQLAKEAESIETAFKNLSTTIGGVADTWLPKLRDSIKGTISDLDLMRIANEAVLLGVAESEDQYAELAGMARRLGRAVGKDTVKAINELTLGIGRQSWRILDNLGLIVKVGAANEEFAARLGKTVAQLSEAEKRQAFMNATLEATRKKMRDLGPDFITLNDRWGMFQATLKNVAVIVSRNIVGAGGIFQTISEYLEKNRKQIGDWARFVANVLERFVLGIANIVKKAFTKAGWAKFFQDVSDFFTKAIPVLMNGIVVLIVKLIPSMFLSITNAIAAEIDVFFQGIGNTVAKFILRQVMTIRGSSEAQIDAAMTAFDVASKKMLEGIEADYRVHGDEVKKLAAEAVKASKVEFGKLGKVVQEAGLFKAFRDAADAVSEEFDKLKEKLKDPFSQETALRIDPQVQNIADIFNDIINIRKSLKDAALIPPAELERTDALLEALRSSVISLSKGIAELGTISPQIAAPYAMETAAAFNDVKSRILEAYQALIKFATADEVVDLLLRMGEALGDLERTDIDKIISDAVTPKFLDEDVFDKEMQRWQQRIAPLEIQVDTTGLKGAEKQIAEFDATWEKFLDNFSPEQQALYEKTRETFVGLVTEIANKQDWIETTKVIDSLNQEIEDMGTQAKIAGYEITELEADLQDLERERLKAIEGKDLLSAEVITQEYEKAADALVKLFRANELRAAVSDLAGSIEKNVGGALIRAFQKGESITKQWAEITAGFFTDAMEKALKILRVSLERAFSAIFRSLGLGSAGAGLAMGLLGLAGLILHTLEARTTQTVEDFSEAINASESVRGVVAGPTNVAISQVGDSLKQALRTTELLLERIAIAVETGIGGGGGSVASFSGGSLLPLSTSTPS